MSDHTFAVRLLILFRNWKRFILTNVAVFTGLALVISLLLPKWYRAEARIVTKSSGLSELGLSGLAENLPFQGLGLIPRSDETLRYLSILNSRTVMMGIAKRFNLQQRYDKPDWEKTLRELTNNTSFESNIDETISIFAWDKSPEFAAQLANAFVRMLDSLNIQLKIEKARNNRIFLQQRLEDAKRDLAAAEQHLKDFQERYGIIEVSEQAKVAIRTIAEVQAQVILKEEELGFKQHFFSEQHDAIKQLELQLQQLRKSLRKLQIGPEHDGHTPTDDFFIPAKDVPELAMNYYRALRDVEVQNLIFKTLTEQFEQARILEAKETPTIQVLDWAVPPIHKDRPKRSFIVIGAFLFSCLTSIFFAVGVERWRDLSTQLQKHVEQEGK